MAKTRLASPDIDERVTAKELAKALQRKWAPHGLPDFAEMALKEIELHSDKNHDYAAGGNPAGNFDRVATILSLYPNFPWNRPEGVAMIYALKQIDATCWNLDQARKSKAEGIDGRLQDVGVYSKIIRSLLKRR